MNTNNTTYKGKEICPYAYYKIIIARRIVFAAIALAIMIIIFYFSSQVAESSSKVSGGFIERVCNTFSSSFRKKSAQEQFNIIKGLQRLVRKTAHFSVYAALGFSLFGFFKTFRIKMGFVALFTFCCGVLYAVSDEIHQLFVCGRSGQISDVLLDACGVGFGLICSLCAHYLFFKIFIHKKQIF